MLPHAHWLGPAAQLHVQTMCLYDIPHLYIPRRARGGGIELIPPALWEGEHGVSIAQTSPWSGQGLL